MSANLETAVKALVEAATFAGYEMTVLNAEPTQIRFTILDEAGDLWTLRATTRGGQIVTLVYPNGNIRQASVKTDMDTVDLLAGFVSEMITDLS